MHRDQNGTFGTCGRRRRVLASAGMSERTLASVSLLALFAAITSAQPSTGGSWPRWRGPGFDGTAVVDGRPLAKPFELKVRWKKKLGPGYSGIVIDGTRAV